ncbi:hypothetical protein HDU67_002415 [Dinochytrium kinnereticum]|nr:hypothetical protein HDU67_002415 [Dinochytrium kinnereticum]
MESMSTAFDWDREVATCDPSYYRWTQYLFLKMYEAGLVNRKGAIVNWDPVDKTVLANEQVDGQGRAERSGAVVEKRMLEQWFIKITAYADDLLKDLELLDWPEKVKSLQAHWIGKEEGWTIDFNLALSVVTIMTNLTLQQHSGNLAIFVTNPSSIISESYLTISPEHPFVRKETSLVPESSAKEVETFINSFRIGKITSNGCSTGLKAMNPFTGDAIDIRVTPTPPLLNDEGNELARLHATSPSAERHSTRMEQKAVKILNSIGTPKAYFRMRDWLISRQRYWGTPIPMIHCKNCGVVPVPENELPVLLPMNVKLTGRGGSPLAEQEDWSKCECPKCKSPDARRDSDTMDTFVDSSWYWLRYLDPKNQKSICNPKVASSLLPVDTYIGGVEHSIMHLLYARFIGKFILRSGLAGPLGSSSKFEKLKGEPFQKLLVQGMVTGRTLKCPDSGRYLRADEVDAIGEASPIIRSSGKKAAITFEKMSKSKFNGVDPSEIISRYGPDCTRLSILYRAAPADELAWEEKGIVGIERWITRCRKMTQALVDAVEPSTETVSPFDVALEKDLRKTIHKTIHEVTNAMSTTRGFHVAIASLIKLTHALEDAMDARAPFTILRNLKNDAIFEGVTSLIRMLQPFAPSLSEELWNNLKVGEPDHDLLHRWPIFDSAASIDEFKVCVIMVNGKSRGTIEIPVAAMSSSKEVERLARESEVGNKWLSDPVSGKKLPMKKVLVLKGGSVVNFLLR